MKIHDADESRDLLPWERQPGEGAPAYRAFCAYRDCPIDPATGDRSKLAAYNSLRPPEKQVRGYWSPKEWNHWARKYDWDGRVGEYDRHLDRIRQKAVEKAVQRKGQMWAEAAEQVREKALKLGLKLMEQAEVLSHFPVVRKTLRENGTVTVWEPIATKDLRDVAAIAQAGLELAGGAAAEGTRAAEQLRDTPDEPDEARRVLARADQELEEWRQGRLEKGSPPRIALDPPAPTTPAAEADGG